MRGWGRGVLRGISGSMIITIRLQVGVCGDWAIFIERKTYNL
jgi:hypothetical protein